MKKLLGIVVLGLLWCNTTLAGCVDDLDDKATYIENNQYLEFEFKSKSDKAIVISPWGLKSTEGTFMKKSNEEIYIKPFGVKTESLYVGDLNLDVAGKYSFECKYWTKSTSQKKPVKKKVKKTEENPALVLIVVFAIIGYIIYKFSKSKEKKSNRKITRENNVPDAEILSKDEIKEKYKIIAKFYNNYKIIDYGKISNKKIAQKQMEDIVNVVDKNLAKLSAGTENTPYRMLIVGIVTFKLTTKEQVIKVHNDLKKMYKKGKLLEFDDRLMTALENILDDSTGIDY